MQTHLFFPTPIVQDTIESDLEQYVMDLSRSDEGVKLSKSTESTSLESYRKQGFSKKKIVKKINDLESFPI